MAKEKKLTVDKSMSDFRKAYRAKKKLIEREKEDFLFALGEQWSAEDKQRLDAAGMKAITDNRIAPNLFLLTGLERQNRTDFKAFPIGEEDGLKAEVASILFKDAIKTSEFSYKSSDQFKDGVTCGESHLELYLDHTEDLLNGKPCWTKIDGNMLFPEPGHKEYDFRDCRYVYKLKLDVSAEDLINLFPSKKKKIEEAGEGRLDLGGMIDSDAVHTQKKDYPKSDDGSDADIDAEDKGFDLLERYYKKWVETYFVGDKEKGQITEAESKEKAQAFVDSYKNKIVENQNAYQQAIQSAIAGHVAQLPDDPMNPVPVDQRLQMLNEAGSLPPPPPDQNPDRFFVFTRLVPEIWCFAHVPGIEEPLDDARAWFYPKWKLFPFVPYFARFSTAPLSGDESHLLIQGIVHGVKGVQEKHNKAEMLMLRHLNTSANSGWIAEEDSWVDPAKVETFGSAPGVNLEYKAGKQMPQRIAPNQLSTGHAEIAAEAAEAIKAQLGINADLLATQQGGADSGRAIALRQRQGLLMVQELFDNLSRSRIIAGRFLLSQLGEIYDTESAQKVLGEAFLIKNFPPPMMIDESGPDPMTGMPKQVPMQDPQTGQPMAYDKQMAEVLIAEVLSGDLGKYDVSVGEAVSSETVRMANSAEIKEIAGAYPGLIPPDILVEESQLPQSTKTRVLAAIKQAQAMQQQAMMQGPPQNPSAVDAEGAA